MKFGTVIPTQNLLGKLDFGTYRQNITYILHVYEAQIKIYQFLRTADLIKTNTVTYL
jgi:hypothetical protein